MKMQVCGCGTNHDATEKAFGIAETIFDRTDGKSCPNFESAVIAGLELILQSVLSTDLYDQCIIEQMPEKERDAVIVASVERMHEISHGQISGSMYKTPEMSKRLADFTQKVTGHDHRRKRLEAGPDEAALAKAGVYDRKAGLELLAALIGARKPR